MKNIVAPQTYRPEIDGLRAIAVLLVVSYHYFGVRGGFVGVDIFFVISGYLISQQIFTDLDLGKFSLLEFYAKRIRRIFPPLLLMILATLIAGWLLLLPTDFQSLGKHAAAGIAYISNLLLWTESGYFDAPSGFKPFLHLWSLGIEEQFYLTWPLAIVLLYRYVRSKLTVLLVLTAVSFALSLLSTVKNQDMAFYMPVTRFWELAAGGVLAYGAQHRSTMLSQYLGQRLSNLLTNFSFEIGLAVLLVVVLLVDKNSAYPGFWALMPVLGTCLILTGRSASRFKEKILTQPLMISIGKISYGIYLWHWPLLVLMHLSDKTSGLAKLVALSLSFILAYCTYLFVEIPVRSITVTRASAIRFIAFGVMSTLVVGLAGILFATGLVHRSWDEKLIHTQYSEAAIGCAADARPDKTIDYAALVLCEKIKFPNRPSVFLLGDSHALGLYQGLSPYLEQEKINLIGLPALYCTPLSLRDARQSCAHYNQWLETEVTRLRPELVVIFAHYALWGEDEHYGEPQAYSTYIWKAAQHLKSLGAGQVLIIGQIPTWINSLPHNLNLNFLRKGLSVPERTTTGVAPESLKIDAAIAAARSPGIEYFSLQQALCQPEGCLTSVGPDYPNDLIVHDYGHLTKNGASYIVQNLLGRKIIDLLE